MTEPKKRGRPAGSKNKPKVVSLYASQIEFAKKFGITPEQLAKEKIKMERKHRKPRKPEINWEKLARELQSALRDEIGSSTKLQDENKNLKLQLDAEKLITSDLTRETNRQRDNMLEMRGIIHYLEGKLENEY